MSISRAEQQFILEGIRDNIRNDGRNRNDIRPFLVYQDATVTTAHGSSRVRVGGGGDHCDNSGEGSGTHLLCSVKAELVHPSPQTPSLGAVEIHVDSMVERKGDNSSKERRMMEQKLQSSLNGLLANHVVDRQRGLCVVSGDYVWKLHIDLVILSDQEGNIMDAASRAIRAAIQCTRLPHLVSLNDNSDEGRRGAQSDLVVDSDIQAANVPSGADECAILVTVCLCKCPPNDMEVLVLDPSLEEEACVSSRVHVSVQPSSTGKLRICGIQSDGGPLPWGILSDVSQLALSTAKKILKQMENSTIRQNVSLPNSMLRAEFRLS